jgi:hypothetical protein
MEGCDFMRTAMFIVPMQAWLASGDVLKNSEAIMSLERLSSGQIVVSLFCRKVVMLSALPISA